LIEREIDAMLFVDADDEAELHLIPRSTTSDDQRRSYSSSSHILITDDV
jgi:hypothetical protein